MKFTRHPTGSLWLNDPVEIEGWQDRNYCSVVITLGGKQVLGKGVARRDPVDKERPELAQQLAFGRALEDAGRRISRRADGLVRHADYVAAEKRRLAAERAPKRRVRRKPK